MSIARDIIVGMWNTTLRYKGVRVNMFGIWCPNASSRDSIYSTISRLKKTGVLEKKSDLWFLTKKGEVLAQKTQFKQFDSINKAPFFKKMLVMFDIPEKHKKERQWLRMHLKRFNFKLIQKSVWVGPRPFPSGFEKYLSTIGIKKYVRVFNISEKI